MSDPLRIALVAEGPTDAVVVEAALVCMLPNRTFILKQLQPEGSLAFAHLGSGWTGVYRWCKQSALRGHGHLSSDSLLFSNYDLLVLHLDSDVADMRYADDGIAPEQSDGSLPCSLPCPPASDTMDALQKVLLTWCGEVVIPDRTIICMPSKSTEAWVVAALFPEDVRIALLGECLPSPENRLRQQPKKVRIRKARHDYLMKQSDLTIAWPRLVHDFVSAQRFQSGTLNSLSAEPNARGQGGNASPP